jgi:two-component system, LytTR family, response regulator
MNLHSIIIDDEPNNIQNLQSILRAYCNEVTVVGVAYNADEGILAIKTHRPALLFLDIQMPGKSGFDVLKAFDQINFEIIFITAYDNYGIQAIKFSALDYLLKPINISELQAAVEKAKQKIIAKQKDNNIDNLLEYLRLNNKEVPKIALPTQQEIRYVSVNDIMHCEASNNYTTFYLQNGEQILVCKTLKEFAELLKPYRFIRTHQSHLVNLHFVKSLLKEDGGILLLNDKTKIRISRQNRDMVKEELNRSL